MEIKEALGELVAKRDLDFEQMRLVTNDIMSGKVSNAQIGAFLVALRLKGETIEEIAAAATSMRQVAAKVQTSKDSLLDTCGTGGDGSNSFNISTASAFVAAFSGINVAKHGNRAASGSSGSADLLEAAGAKIDLTPKQISLCIENFGIGFMFAPAHHKATKHVFGPRREIGVRTIFNFLGPLTNPAGAANQLIGVFDILWVEKMAHVLKRLGSQRALVVCSLGGMDEIAIDKPTKVAELNKGTIRLSEINPELFGVNMQSHEHLIANSPEASLQIMTKAFEGSDGPALDIVSLNAGAAIYIGGGAETLQTGIQKAKELLKSGNVLQHFEEFCKFTQTFG